MKFCDFKLDKLFQWQSQKEIDPLKISSLEDHKMEKYPFYGQATINNGIISYLSLCDDVLNNKEGKPTILIHSNNGNIVYLETPFYLKDGHGATSVLQSPNLDENTALYLITAIRKTLSKTITWSDKATKTVLKNTFISLPAIDKNTPDYEYMRKQILNMKKSYNDKLCVLASKLQLNSSLSEFEKDVLFRKQKTSSRRVDVLFDIHPTKSYGLTNDKLYATIGCTPVISNSSVNNGIGGYVDLKPTEKGGIITFSDTTTGADTVFYQPDDFIGYSHIQGMYPWNPELWNENSMLYFIVAFKKAVGKWYDWSTKLTRDICNSLEIELPVDDNGNIDYKYMSDYILAQKKLSYAKLEKSNL